MKRGMLSAFKFEKKHSNSRSPPQWFWVTHDEMDYKYSYYPEHDWEDKFVWATEAGLTVQSGGIEGFFLATEATLLFLPKQKTHRKGHVKKISFTEIERITVEKPRMTAFDHVVGAGIGLVSGVFAPLTVPAYYIAQKTLMNVVEIRQRNGDSLQFYPIGYQETADIARDLQAAKSNAMTAQDDVRKEESIKQLKARLAERKTTAPETA